jgi:hypothetical protein
MNEKEKTIELLKEAQELGGMIIKLFEEIKPDPNAAMHAVASVLVSLSLAFNIRKEKIMDTLESHWSNYKKSENEQSK